MTATTADARAVTASGDKAWGEAVAPLLAEARESGVRELDAADLVRCLTRRDGDVAAAVSDARQVLGFGWRPVIAPWGTRTEADVAQWTGSR